MKRRCEDVARQPESVQLLGKVSRAVYWLQMCYPATTNITQEAFKVLRSVTAENVQPLSEDGIMAAICLHCIPEDRQSARSFAAMPKSIFSRDCIDVCVRLHGLFLAWKNLSIPVLKAGLMCVPGYWLIILLELEKEIRKIPQVELEAGDHDAAVEFVRSVLNATDSVQCALHDSLDDLISLQE